MRPIPKWAVIVYAIAVILFMLSVIAIETIPLEGMRNIQTAYITVNIAIIAVAFAAMGINPNFKESISLSMLKISLLSSFGLFTCIFSYFISYGSLTTTLTNTVLFGASTAITIISIFYVVLIIFDYIPKKE